MEYLIVFSGMHIYGMETGFHLHLKNRRNYSIRVIIICLGDWFDIERCLGMQLTFIGGRQQSNLLVYNVVAM